MTSETHELTHPDAAELLSYLSDELDETEAEAIELHLFDCDDCARVSRRVHLLEQVWRRWDAGSHGALHLRLLLDRGLSLAEERTSRRDTQSRLQRWRHTWAGTAEAALRTVLATGERAAHTTASAVAALSRPGTGWSFAPQASFGGAWGDADHDDSVMLATTPHSSDGPSALVQVRGGEDCEIIVRIDHLAAHCEPPLVVLLALRGAGEVDSRLAELARLPGSESWTARFGKLLPGEYIVAFEPLETAMPPR